MSEFLNEERAERMTLNGEEYALMLTVRAMRDIAQQFGGLDGLGHTLSESKDAVKAMDTVVWLFCLLSNQTILIANKLTGESQPLVDPEELALTVTPADMATMQAAVLAAIRKGTQSSLQSSEDTGKN